MSRFHRRRGENIQIETGVETEVAWPWRETHCLYPHRHHQLPLFCPTGDPLAATMRRVQKVGESFPKNIIVCVEGEELLGILESFREIRESRGVIKS